MPDTSASALNDLLGSSTLGERYKSLGLSASPLLHPVRQPFTA